MRQVCNATVIRGNGPEVEVIINGVKDKALENEREITRYVKRRRNQLLGSKLHEERKLFAGKDGVLKRIQEKLILVWATVWVYGEAIGLWAWEEENDR